VADVFADESGSRQGEWACSSGAPERRAEYQNEHRRLVEAIKNRDRLQAIAVAIEHLLRVRRNLLDF
jgi:DNA-binding GntR family transcriptional regulator